MKKEQSNCWVNPVWWSLKGQDTLNLFWRSGLSRSRRDSSGAVFQKDKRANLGSSPVQWRAVSIWRSKGVFKKKEIGGKPPPWKKVGHGGQAGATTVQSCQNRERNLKSWSSKVYSRIGNTNGAVQLSGAKAFSLD